MGEAKRRKAAGLPPRGWLEPPGTGAVGVLEPNGEARAELRAQVIDAMHTAMDAADDGGGVGSCFYYAVIGGLVLTRLLGQRYELMAGGLSWVPDPDAPDEWIEVVPRPDALETGEYHAWLARERPLGATELVDFSTRHLPSLTAAWAERRGGPSPWRRSASEAAPAVWCATGELPPWVRYRADQAMTRGIRRALAASSRVCLASWRDVADAVVDLVQRPETAYRFFGPGGIVVREARR